MGIVRMIIFCGVMDPDYFRETFVRGDKDKTS